MESSFTLELAGSPSVMVGRVEWLWMVKLARVPSLSSSFWAWKYQAYFLLEQEICILYYLYYTT